ncbi:AAA family ATPase [Streptosporangium sp. NPDC000509]|uniref:5-methylcytosine restriction system specificity protein McrC n=1 Tax=Streptosporangium sp. NPDC000509 TaxID=3366186 RepID=UPI0036BCEDF7
MGDWLAEGYCSLPASKLRELPPGATQEAIRAAVDEDYAHGSYNDRLKKTAEFHAFLSRMREDDLVLSNDGGKVYLGWIKGGPAFRASVENRANLQRPVEWSNPQAPLDFADDLPDAISAKLATQHDVLDLTEFAEELEALVGSETAKTTVVRDLVLPDVDAELAEELLVDRDWLQECVELLRDRPQLIFYGPPGTGKTYLAQHLAQFLVGGKPENVKLVQFHPVYFYEDFFEGFRPVQTADGQGVTFKPLPGPLLRLVDAARQHPEEPYVLIIDEINRGNLAKIFGELYFLLEYRDKAVDLLYSSAEGTGQAFTLPENLVIIGTMNTADRALRRGVLQGYREVEEALPVLRGRIREADQIRRRYGLPLPVEVRYDDYTVDIAENRLLLPGLAVPTRRTLRHVIARLAGVSAAAPGPDIPPGSTRATRPPSAWRNSCSAAPPTSWTTVRRSG